MKNIKKIYLSIVLGLTLLLFGPGSVFAIAPEAPEFYWNAPDQRSEEVQNPQLIGDNDAHGELTSEKIYYVGNKLFENEENPGIQEITKSVTFPESKTPYILIINDNGSRGGNPSARFTDGLTIEKGATVYLYGETDSITRCYMESNGKGLTINGTLIVRSGGISGNGNSSTSGINGSGDLTIEAGTVAGITAGSSLSGINLTGKLVMTGGFLQSGVSGDPYTNAGIQFGSANISGNSTVVYNSKQGNSKTLEPTNGLVFDEGTYKNGIISSSKGEVFGQVDLTSSGMFRTRMTLGSETKLMLENNDTLVLPKGESLGVAENATLQINEGGSFSVSDGSALKVKGSGIINNQGTLTYNTGSTIENNGTINNTGSLYSYVNVTGSGSVKNNGAVYVLPGTTPGELEGDGNFTSLPQPNGKIANISMSANGVLSYYNSNNQKTPSSFYQTGNISFNITGTSNNFTPESVNWSVDPIFENSNGLNVPKFVQNWKDQTGPTLETSNSSVSIYTGSRRLYSEDNNWFLEYSYSEKTPVNGERSVSYSNLTLNYNGAIVSTATTPDFYQLKAQATNVVTGVTNPLTASVRFSVANSEVQQVIITNADGSTLNNPYTIDLKAGRTVQFGYQATGENNRLISNGNTVWSLQTLEGNSGTPNISSANISQYVRVNSITGEVTVIQPFPQYNYVLLSLSVDGIGSDNQVLLTTTGAVDESINAIEPIYNPVYTTAETIYNLTSNITSVPFGTSFDVKALSFESSNPQLPIYNGTQIVAPSSNYIGTTTITAVLTLENNQKLTTSYVLNITKSVMPTGVEALETVYLDINNPESVNVSAHLLPANSTVQPLKNDFDYKLIDETFAIVDVYGNITPVAVGSTQLVTTYLLPNNKSVSYTTNVIVQDGPAKATNIEIDPIAISLTTVEGGQTSYDISALVTPDLAGLVTWESSAPTVATVTANGQNTATITAVSEGQAIITANYGDISATTTVLVSDEAVYAAEVMITAETPDYYTVTVDPQVNTAAGYTDSVQQISIFTWSKEDQSDMNCKVATPNINGTYSYSFPVNNTPDHEYYSFADSIKINIYGSTEAGENGNMIAAATYKSVNTQSAQNNAVAYIAYVAYEGFEKPTVFDGQTAGTVDSGIRCEGVRISSNIAGVEINTSVHAENIGWMDAEIDGAYAGTMHESRQIEALNLTLSGVKADDYALSYRVYQAGNGWSEWVTAGQDAGVIGQHDMMEAFEVQLLPITD